MHNDLLSQGTSLFVSTNSTNRYIATANIDGNISIRSISDIKKIYEAVPHPITNELDGEQSPKNGTSKIATNDQSHSLTTSTSTPPLTITPTPTPTVATPSIHTVTQFNISKAPELDPALITAARNSLNVVGVRSRSKITSLRYANLITNANLMAAIYKNGEVYIITNPQDINKCRIQQIFKHVNGLLLDFSWSADDQLMAFSSMNNEVIIYDVIYGKVIATLYLHTNSRVITSKNDKNSIEEISTPVKGITFDRLNNNHLFTLGDDRVLNIIKYKLVYDEVLGRKFEYTIVNQMNDIISSAKLNKANIKKISISPDDKLIACPNTSKSKVLKLSILSHTENLDDWKVAKEFVASGLKSFMTCFSPNIYKNSATNENFYLISTLAPDNAFSLWRSDSTTPLYIYIDPSNSILDMCWSSDGLLLFLTFNNGSMSVLIFKEDEFGKPLYPNNELSVQLHKVTRQLLPIEFDRMTKWRLLMKDHPLKVQQKELEVLQNEKKKLKWKTIEVKSEQNLNNTNTATKKTPEPSVSNTKEIEKQAETTKELNNSITKEQLNDSKFKDIRPKDKSMKEIKVKEKTTQQEKITNQNKPTHPQNIETSKKSVASTTAPTKATREVPKKRLVSASNYDLPSNQVPKDINGKVVKMAKRDVNQFVNGASTTLPATQTTKKKREAENVEFVGSVVINPQISFSNIRIAIPKLRNNINYKIPDNESLILQIKNGNGLESQPTRISLTKEVIKGENKQIFVDFIPHKIHIVCGSSKFIALSTASGYVLTYSESGRRVLPPIVLGSPLSFLEIKDFYLLAVTSTGELFVWNLEEKKSEFKPISLYPLLQPLYSSGQASAMNRNQNSSDLNNNDNMGNTSNISTEQNGLVFVNGELLTRSENLTVCSITSQGIPIVTLSNGNGYLFNKMMNAWSLISDSWWAFGSQYWDSSLSIDNVKDFGLLEYMESHTNDEINRRGKAKFFSKISKMMLMREGYENLETIISLNHLENKINFYIFLNDFENYKMFLIIYAKRLSELNLKNRLVEILNSLFMDMNGEICGHPKKKLLEDLILSCSKHREVQHILVQYSESIGILNADDDDIL